MKLDDVKEQVDHLQDWAQVRNKIESSKSRLSCMGKRISTISLVDYALPFVSFFLKTSRLYQKGVNNAKNIRVRNLELSFDDLPVEFDQYRILHITDLHIDGLPGLEDILLERIKTLSYDLALFTGDYRKENEGPFLQIVEPMKKIVDHLQAPDGVYGVLGNHDSHHMVEALRQTGLNLMINQSISIGKQQASITLTGIDDPHYYFTQYSKKALAESEGTFKILMAHTPEISKLAAYNKYNLYLCGHTHGGQICLPGGIPVVTQLVHEKDKYYGLWQEDQMIGYTSSGAGISGLPIRFFCPGEISLITLRKKS
ncbi:MAG: metallophosphoesterase [Candidatus Cyclobacteriaceae bacterium M3_2C_046]